MENNITNLEKYKNRDELGKYEKYKKHGLPFDRGAADAWYARGPEPHYWTEGSYGGEQITKDQMDSEELEAYYAGYYIHEDDPGYRKEWD